MFFYIGFTIIFCMKLELLVSALKAEPKNLIAKMNIPSDVVLVNQCDLTDNSEFIYSGHTVKVFSNTDRGVGLSRNLAIANSTADLILFSDDDIIYNDDCEKLILSEFEAHPEADGIFFNFEVDESRQTYHIDEFGPVKITASGRYPTYSLCIKRECVINNGLSFSPLFGGGAKYSCGEDSLFIVSALKAGVKLFKSPVTLGHEEFRPSTWFNGYTEKFFFDKGVLYHFLYKHLAFGISIRFILKHKSLLCRDVAPMKALRLMAKGIREGRKIEKEDSR